MDWHLSDSVFLLGWWKDDHDCSSSLSSSVDLASYVSYLIFANTLAKWSVLKSWFANSSNTYHQMISMWNNIIISYLYYSSSSFAIITSSIITFSLLTSAYAHFKVSELLVDVKSNERIEYTVHSKVLLLLHVNYRPIHEPLYDQNSNE